MTMPDPRLPDASAPDTDTPPSRAARIGLTVAFAAPFLLVAVAFLVGSRSPAARTVERSVEVEADVRQVFALLASPREQPTWWRRVERIEPLGTDEMVRQVFHNGRTAHIIVEPGEVAPDLRLLRLVWRIRDPAGPYRGTWRFDLEPTDRGVRVTLREEARLGNPFARFLVAIAGGGGFLVDDCLDDLAAWAEQVGSSRAETGA